MTATDQTTVTGKCTRPEGCKRNAAVHTMDGQMMCRQHADLTNEKTHGPILAAQRGARVRAEVYANPLFWLTGPHDMEQQADEALGRKSALYQGYPADYNWHYGNQPDPADFRTIPPLTLEEAAATVRSAREAVSAATPQATEQRLSGEPSSREEILRKYRAESSRWDDLERARYWRVQLNCGHVLDWLTQARGLGGVLPADGRGETPAEENSGYFRYHWSSDYSFLGKSHTTCNICEAEKAPLFHFKAPIRERLIWSQPELHEREADSERAKLIPGRAEPDAYTRWNILLSCGHHDIAVTEPLWNPEDGVVRDPEEAQKVAERWAAHGESDTMPEITKHEIADGWPEPSTMDCCEVCAAGRWIVAYEYHGPLSVPTIPAAPRRLAALERRVQAAEEKAHELRCELRELEGGEPAPWPRYSN